MWFDQLAAGKLGKFRVIHSLPGRLRIHIPFVQSIAGGLGETRAFKLEPAIDGIKNIDISFITGRALIFYDHSVLSEDDILTALSETAKVVWRQRKEFQRLLADNQEEALDYLVKLTETQIDFLRIKQSVRDTPNQERGRTTHVEGGKTTYEPRTGSSTTRSDTLARGGTEVLGQRPWGALRKF